MIDASNTHVIAVNRCRIFPRLWEPIFTQAMSRTRNPKISPKTPFLHHSFGQAMSKWLLGDVKLNITSPDLEILVFLHVWCCPSTYRCTSLAPLSFFSKNLSSAETHYSAFNRELLAVYAAIHNFLLMLEGREFFVLTDHKPLCHALGRLSTPWSSNGIWHIFQSSPRTSCMSLTHNVDDDALLRPPQLSCLAPADIPPFLKTRALSAMQAACSAIAALTSDQRSSGDSSTTGMCCFPPPQPA